MKEALITGATGGIGRALAHKLTELGIALTLVGRDELLLRELQEKLAKKSEVRYFVCDHGIPEEQAALEKFVRERSFDLIVNNAGFGLYGGGVTLPLHAQQLMIDVNIKALLGLTLVGAEAMISKGIKGMIMNISSLASFFPTPLMAVYGATKAFVTSFSEALDYELSPKGVRVLAACPGMVESGFAEKAARKRVSSIRGQMSCDFVAREILWQIMQKKGVHLPGWRSSVTLFLAKLIPRSWQMKVVYNNIKKRI